MLWALGSILLRSTDYKCSIWGKSLNLFSYNSLTFRSALPTAIYSETRTVKVYQNEEELRKVVY